LAERHCGTCIRLGKIWGKYGAMETYCTIDGKARLPGEMKGCLGYKKRKEAGKYE